MKSCVKTEQLQKSVVWFVVGSQHLYGEETLQQVKRNAEVMANALNDHLPIEVVLKPVMTTPGDITSLCQSANADTDCTGLILWMHTFSPAKMWLAGLKQLVKPWCHWHTQFEQHIPWQTIDMDYMNLHQAAHGDREFASVASRLRLRRKIVVGHWKDQSTLNEMAVWVRAAMAWADWQDTTIARFGDNMRQVSVTEGDKVAAQSQFGFSVDGYGVGDLVEVINAASEQDVRQMLQAYADEYEYSASDMDSVNIKNAARIEAGLRSFLSQGNYKGLTNTFEDLHGLPQLPGISIQRLMRDGYGFGAEGDWKTSALLRAAKVMGAGLDGGHSFMEDYTYHFGEDKDLVLGAHMLEVCESIASKSTKPQLKIKSLGIGGKEAPVRLIFSVDTGPATMTSLVDLGDRFRLIVNNVETVECPDLPELPNARALWEPKPDLKTSAAAWMYSGGAHHAVFSQSLDQAYYDDFADIAGIEKVAIDQSTTIETIKQTLAVNDVIYRGRNSY